jgi:hypothetical protein
MEKLGFSEFKTKAIGLKTNLMIEHTSSRKHLEKHRKMSANIEQATTTMAIPPDAAKLKATIHCSRSASTAHT